jgi:hypothetical protein
VNKCAKSVRVRPREEEEKERGKRGEERIGSEMGRRKEK